MNPFDEVESCSRAALSSSHPNERGAPSFKGRRRFTTSQLLLPGNGNLNLITRTRVSF